MVNYQLFLLSLFSILKIITMITICTLSVFKGTKLQTVKAAIIAALLDLLIVAACFI